MRGYGTRKKHRENRSKKIGIPNSEKSKNPNTRAASKPSDLGLNLLRSIYLVRVKVFKAEVSSSFGENRQSQRTKTPSKKRSPEVAGDPRDEGKPVSSSSPKTKPTNSKRKSAHNKLFKLVGFPFT